MMMLQLTLLWIGGPILKMDLILFLESTLDVTVGLGCFILMDLNAFLLFKLYIKKYIFYKLSINLFSFSGSQDCLTRIRSPCKVSEP